MTNINCNKNDNLPVMMYLHGCMSGANGAKQRQLQKRFKGQFRVIAPELYAKPEISLKIINELIEKEKPEIIVGTSLGGFMALMCEAADADLVIVNPCLFPNTQLALWCDKELPYFCQRLDGVQTYRLTQAVLDRYLDYNIFDILQAINHHVWALCSTADDLLGDSHVQALEKLLPKNHLTIVDDFGHQCNGAGLTHLYDLIERVIAYRRY